MGKSRSGPPLLNAHYNLLLPTVTHDIPPARPLRFSIVHDCTWNRGVTIGSIVHMVELVEFIKFILCAGFQSVNSVRCAGGVKLE